MLRYICDICGTVASTVFCHTDSTSLCSSCDDYIHAEANPMAGHHFRVPIQTTTNPLSSLLYQQLSTLNHCQSGTAAARDEFFYCGSDKGECFDDLIAFDSSCSSDVLKSIHQDCEHMNVPIMHSVEQSKSLKGNQLWIEHPEVVSTVQASHQHLQTVPTSVVLSRMRPEIKLSFTTTKQSGPHDKSKTVEWQGAEPCAEKAISREERVQRFRAKRQGKKTWTKNKFPSKKAYAASIRPRINGKFARGPSDK